MLSMINGLPSEAETSGLCMPKKSGRLYSSSVFLFHWTDAFSWTIIQNILQINYKLYAEKK